MKIIQVATGLISIPPNGWGAVERIEWEYKRNLKMLGIDAEIKNWNEIVFQENTIVHCHMSNTAIDMRDKGIPYIYSLHDHHAEWYGRDSGVYKSNLEAIKGSVISICHSKHIIDYFDGTAKLFYVPHGVNTEFFTTTKKWDEHKLLMIANNGLAGDSTIDRKGFRYAIEAAKKLHLPITIAGPENNHAFFEGHKDLLEYAGLTLKLTNPTDDETLKLYQSHTIFLAPSFLEYGHPNLTLLEAMSTATPIVGTCNDFLEGMYRIPEITTDAVVTGIQDVISGYDSYRKDMMYVRINYDWIYVCATLKKLYDACSVIGMKWYSETTKQAYIDVYTV